MSYFTRKKCQLKLQILSLPQSPSSPPPPPPPPLKKYNCCRKVDHPNCNTIFPAQRKVIITKSWIFILSHWFTFIVNLVSIKTIYNNLIFIYLLKQYCLLPACQLNTKLIHKTFDLFTEGVCEQRAGGQGLRFVTKILQLPRDVPATVTSPYSLRHCWIQPAHHPVPRRDSNSVWCCSDHCQRGVSQWYDSFI